MVKLKEKNIQISSFTVRPQLDIATDYKRELKDCELIDEPNDCKNKILKRAANILISDTENVEGVTIHPLDPRSTSCVGKSSQFTETLFKRNLWGNYKQRKKDTFNSSGHYLFAF